MSDGMGAATECWECGRRTLSGVCEGPHDFGTEEWDRAIWRGNAERGPIRRNPRIKVHHQGEAELRYLEYLRAAAVSKYKQQLSREVARHGR